MQRIGTFFLAAGMLIVLCVLLIWFTAPLIDTNRPDTTAVAVPSNPPNSAPALSPYTPSNPSTVGNKLVNEPPLADTSAPAAPAGSLVEQPSSSDWRVISYAENKMLGDHDRASTRSSLVLSIPALGIDAPIIPVSLVTQQGGNRRPYQQWSVPNSYAAGWHDSSAPPGQTGNTVLNGHNNIHDAVFGNLVDLTLGEQIILHEGDRKHIYQVVHREFLPEQGESLRTRLWNARWIAPSDDERLTIVTCWPNTSNSHRLVVVAQPLLLDPGL